MDSQVFAFIWHSEGLTFFSIFHDQSYHFWRFLPRISYFHTRKDVRLGVRAASAKDFFLSLFETFEG